MNRLVVHSSVLDVYGAHVHKWEKCQDCQLHKTARQKIFCRGVLPAHVLFIGEAPGASEDDTGYPFVGRCGEILDEIIADSIGAYNISKTIAQSTKPTLRYCMTNSVLCRPDDNSPPEKQHREACSKRLAEFITICKPRLIVTVGKVADAAYIGVLKHLPEIIRCLSIAHPGYMIRREDLALEQGRAVAAIRSGLCNIFSRVLFEMPTETPQLTDEELPF